MRGRRGQGCLTIGGFFTYVFPSRGARRTTRDAPLGPNLLAWVHAGRRAAAFLLRRTEQDTQRFAVLLLSGGDCGATPQRTIS